MIRIATALATCLLGALLSGCTSFQNTSFANYQTFAAPSGEYYDTPLASGQIIMTGSQAPTDILLGVVPPEFSPYVHLGIVVIDEAEPYVYEAVGEPSLSFNSEVPPTATIVGNVQRVPLAAFVQRYFYAEVFEPTGANRRKVAEFARYHLAAATPFDPFFDFSDDSAFFCAEFVARGLEHGGRENVRIDKNRPNHSISVVMEWLGVPEETIATASLVDPATPVMRISVHSDSEILALNAVKQELHRRFTADQTIGNLFRWDGLRPALRMNGQRFLDSSLAAAAWLPPEPEVIQAHVRATADALYGESRD